MDKEVASEPKKCERGTYTSDEGQSSCLDARAGYYVASDGASEQKECPKGETSKPEASSCDPCPSGSFAANSASPSCTLARAGHYVSGDDRTKETPCEEGYYSPGPGASACFACSAGSFSEATGATKCTFCLLYTSPSPRDQRGSRMPSSA